MAIWVLGADPGVTTGLFLLRLEPDPDIVAAKLSEGSASGPGLKHLTPELVAELNKNPVPPVPLVITGRQGYACTHEGAGDLARYLAESNRGLSGQVFGAGEKFIDARGPGARSAEAAITRRVIADLNEVLVTWTWRTAAAVKPWARDRLKAARLEDMTAKSVDMRDAAMQAIFSAVHDCGLPDPLSRKKPW